MRVRVRRARALAFQTYSTTLCLSHSPVRDPPAYAHTRTPHPAWWARCSSVRSALALIGYRSASVVCFVRTCTHTLCAYYVSAVFRITPRRGTLYERGSAVSWAIARAARRRTLRKTRLHSVCGCDRLLCATPSLCTRLLKAPSRRPEAIREHISVWALPVMSVGRGFVHRLRGGVCEIRARGRRWRAPYRGRG